MRAAFATEGMTFADVEGVPVPNFVRATDELMAGSVMGSFLAPGSGIVRKANARIGIRFLSLPETAANAAKVQSIAPGAFYTEVKPSKQMGSVSV